MSDRNVTFALDDPLAGKTVRHYYLTPQVQIFS
jgi:hypothetical protein